MFFKKYFKKISKKLNIFFIHIYYNLKLIFVNSQTLNLYCIYIKKIIEIYF